MMEYSHNFHSWIRPYAYDPNNEYVYCEICRKKERIEKSIRRENFHECLRNLLLSYKDDVNYVKIIAFLKKILKSSERDLNILFIRCGLDDFRNITLKEIGLIFGISGSRVRQIEFKLIRKLRHPINIRKLCDFLKKGVK